MTHQNPPDHFKGKTVAAHLKEARLRGAKATAETHGTELPGLLSAAADSGKDIGLAFLLIWAVMTALQPLSFSLMFLFIGFGGGWVIWKTGRSALLGWARLERLHRLIEEERWEIEHHRSQEKEELKEIYEAKGFSGKLLNEVVDVLMADDNRLLRVMLEEELGVPLEAYEHPLKQALGAFLGSISAAGILLLAYYFWPYIGFPVVSLVLIATSSHLAALFEKRKNLHAVIWNLAVGLFSAFGGYFLTKWIM